MAQPQDGGFARISSTAFITSSARQFTDIPYAKELSELVPAQRLAGLSVMLEARYKTVDRLIAQDGATQILELASGFLPRGLAMSANPDLTFIESDLPEMIQNKKLLAGKIAGERSNLHFLEIDATSRPSQLLRSAPYFNAERPIMILCEGLLMYLTEAEKRRVCDNVREMLRRYGGVWVTPDFTSTMGLRQSIYANPELQRQVAAASQMTGRSLEGNAFETLEQARRFVSEQEFHLTESSMLDVMDQLASLETVGIKHETARRMLSVQSVFALTLR
jgi:O-methyltransferase involved in polyketide biosynthesis